MRPAEAEALLFRTVQSVDPITGVTRRRRVETPDYRAHRELRAAYEAARAAYEAAHQEAQRTASGRSTWPLLATTLQLPVKQSYERWRAAGAERFEQAEALLERTEAARRG